MRALLVPARYVGCLANFRFFPEHPGAHKSGHLFRCRDGDQREGLCFAYQPAPRFTPCFFGCWWRQDCATEGLTQFVSHVYECAWLVVVKASTLLVGHGRGPMQGHMGVMSPMG